MCAVTQWEMLLLTSLVLVKPDCLIEHSIPCVQRAVLVLRTSE